MTPTLIVTHTFSLTDDSCTLNVTKRDSQVILMACHYCFSVQAQFLPLPKIAFKVNKVIKLSRAANEIELIPRLLNISPTEA